MKYIFLLAVFVVLFFVPIFLNQDVFLHRQNDLDENFYPIVQFWKHSLFEDKTFPIWREDILGRYPFVIDPQPLMYYAPNWILLVLPFGVASILLFAMHLWIVGVGTFMWLATSFRRSPFASFVGGIIVALSPIMVSHIASGHLNMVEAMALVPWSLFFLERAFSTQKIHFFLLWSLTLSFLYFLYATIWYYTLIGMIIYSVVLFLKLRSWLGITWLIGFGFLHLSLIAVMLLPQAVFGHLTTRDLLTLEDIAIPVWSFSRFAAHLVFPVKDEILATASESMLFVGWTVMVLAFIGWLHVSRWWKIFSLVVGSMVLLFFAGTRTPVFPVFVSILPGLSYLRVSTRGVIVALVFLTPLVALGTDSLRSEILKKLSIIFILAEFLLIGWWWIFQSEPSTLKQEIGLITSVTSIVNEKGGRIYCTTHCLSQFDASRARLRLLDGNYPIQMKSIVNAMQEAGGYSFDGFSVIHPPYQVYDQKPQPDAEKLSALGVSVVLSPYELIDRSLDLQVVSDDVFVYINTRFTKEQTLAHLLPSETDVRRWFMIGGVISIISLIMHGAFFFYGNKKRMSGL
ncbi:MAG: hypothetical protein Q8R11_01425 [bacterium]|nr:hypothetical protein [bacterium]